MRRVGFVLVVVAALGAAALWYLPWWAGVGGLLGLALGAKVLGGRLLRGFLLSLFAAKGAALRGARAHFLDLTPAGAPPREGGDAEERASLARQRFCHLDIEMVVPEASGETPFRLWDPAELMLVKMDARPGMDLSDDEAAGEIHGVEVLVDGRWVPCEEKLEGTQRIRLHAGVHPGVKRFQLRYYFEVLPLVEERRAA